MRSLLLLIVCAAYAGSTLTAADADVRRLLETGWEASPSARGEVDRAFEEIATQGRADQHTAYAYGLVLIKQRRYDEAIKQLDSVLKVDPHDVPARQNKIRLLMLTRAHPAAMVEIGLLSRTLADMPAERLPRERREETLRFLGRVIGFLEGPAEGDVAAPTRQRLQREVERRLAEQELAIYDLARHGVLQRFVAMSGESEREREEAVAENERQREEAKRDLEERRDEQQDRRAELLERRDQLRKEAQDLEAARVKAIQPLLDRLAILDRRATVPRRELAVLLTDIDRLRLLAAQSEDPIEREQLLFRARQLEVLAARFDADLTALERQAAAVNAERAAIEDRHRRDLAALSGSVQSIDKELEAQQRVERRFAVDERRLEKPLTGGTRRVRALEAEAAAFTTYEPLPLEEERQRLLEALAP